MTETTTAQPATNTSADALSVSATAPAAAPAAQAQGTVQQASATQGQQPPTAGDAGKLPSDAAKDAKVADAGEAKPQGAPERYEFKAVEGRELDSETMSVFAEVAKEANLSQDAAQRILDRMAPAMAARQQAALETMRSDWTEATKTDKDIGGDKLPETLTFARKALDQFGSPNLRALLNESGLGNHPDVIRMFYAVGRSISEDTYVGRGSAQGGKPQVKSFADAAAALYSNQP